MYGLDIPEIGTIGDNYRAFYLSEHGRATRKESSYLPMVQFSTYPFKNTYEGEYVLAFMELEKNNYDSRGCMIHTAYHSASAFTNIGSYDPYIYVYTTRKPPTLPNQDYGIEIYNSRGNPVYTNSHNTLTVLTPLSLSYSGSGSSGIITSPNGTDMTNRRIAISNTGIGLRYIPTEHQLIREIRAFRRIDNTIQTTSSGAGINQSHAQGIAASLNDSIGLPPGFRNINIGINVIDVTGIR